MDDGRQRQLGPICKGPVKVQEGESTITYEALSLLIDPDVLTRAAEACRIVARSIAGGTATTVRVNQLVADEAELRKLAQRLQG